MEKNKQNLVQAIIQLPEYEPPDLLWYDLAEQLDFEEKIQTPLREMPNYTPPSALWDELAIQIADTPELKPKSSTRPAFKWLAMVLLLALVSYIGFGIKQSKKQAPVETQMAPTEAPKQLKANEPIAQIAPAQKQTATKPSKDKNRTNRSNPQPKRTHRTEVVDDVLIMACQQSDDSHYSIIESLCQEALPVCEEPQFKKLKAELDELTRAHDELKNALGNYADEAELVAQLVEIERSRNQILQQLITMI